MPPTFRSFFVLGLDDPAPAADAVDGRVDLTPTPRGPAVFGRPQALLLPVFGRAFAVAGRASFRLAFVSAHPAPLEAAAAALIVSAPPSNTRPNATELER